MKKILITIGSVMILSLVVVLFVNAINSPKDPEKPKTEINKDGMNPADCPMHAKVQAAKSETEACEEMKENCDPATCTMHKEEQKEISASTPAAPCCPGMKTATK